MFLVLNFGFDPYVFDKVLLFYSLRKSNSHSGKRTQNAQHKCVIILEYDAKQLYLILKVSYRSTNNLSA